MNNIFKILILLFLLLIFCFGSISYVKTEIYTNTQAKEIPTVKICKQEISYFVENKQEWSNQDPKLINTKIIEISKIEGEAKIYCLFSDQKYNLEISLVKRKEWSVVYIIKLNKDKSWYWPYYFN